MKKIKKIMAAVLALVMTMALSLTAFAADGQSNLTVNVNSGNTLKGQTLSVYQLFEMSNGSYVVNPQYETILKSVLQLESGATSGDIYQAVQNRENDIQDFANKFAAEAVKNKLNPTESAKITTDERSHTFDNLNYGYYLVYQTGTLTLQSSLVNLNDTTKTVNLKGQAPSIDKEADKATVEIGNVVTYTVTSVIPDTTNYAQYIYKIHDTLSEGLDFVADGAGNALVGSNLTVSVKIEGVDPAEEQTATVTDRTMELDLSNWVKQPATQNHKGKSFTVTYYAKVNENAVVDNVKNNAKLEYGNDPQNKTETTPVVVVTPTYPLDINKIIKGTQTMLADATFRIYRSEEDAKEALGNLAGDMKAIPVKKVAEGSYKVDPTSAEKDMVTVESKVDGKGNLHLNGLAAGDYWLVETKAPSGYNAITAPIKVTITKISDTDWTVTMGDGTQVNDKTIDIENSTGTILPGTGGMGTTIFTVVAVVLIVGVAVSFVCSKKKTSK